MVDRDPHPADELLLDVKVHVDVSSSPGQQSTATTGLGAANDCVAAGCRILLFGQRSVILEHTHAQEHSGHTKRNGVAQHYDFF